MSDTLSVDADTTFFFNIVPIHSVWFFYNYFSVSFFPCMKYIFSVFVKKKLRLSYHMQKVPRCYLFNSASDSICHPRPIIHPRYFMIFINSRQLLFPRLFFVLFSTVTTDSESVFVADPGSRLGTTRVETDSRHYVPHDGVPAACRKSVLVLQCNSNMSLAFEFYNRPSIQRLSCFYTSPYDRYSKPATLPATAAERRPASYSTFSSFPPVPDILYTESCTHTYIAPPHL